MMLHKDSLKFDLEEAVKVATLFIRGVVEHCGALGVAVGLSGGVDSSVAAALCVRALGGEKVLGVLMPTEFTPADDIDDAVGLAEILGMRTELVDVQPIINVYFKSLGLSGQGSERRMASANILARTRMILLYYYANVNNYLVVGTGDRSEALIGYFTKYGDGAADFFPIRHLYKTQVRELARYLGVPEKIAYKPSSPQLYPGHRAIDEIPLDYDKLDLVLAGLFDCGMMPSEVSQATGIPLKIVMEVQRRHKETEHKRASPPTIGGSSKIVA